MSIHETFSQGADTPAVVNTDSCSGEIILRIPESLHYRLVIEARLEGISLNQYIIYKLTKQEESSC